MKKESKWTPEELVAEGKKYRRKWAKRVGAELVAVEDDGNIELWAYGKAHSRKYETVNYVTATQRPSWVGEFKPYKEEILHTKKFAETRLIEDWGIQPDEYLDTENGSFACLYTYLNNSSNPYSKYHEDDVPTLLAKMIYFIDRILEKDADHDFQLRYAAILGQTITQHDYIVKTAPKNKARAQEDRTPELKRLIARLSKKNDKAKDLWDIFISDLQSELDAELNEVRSNPHNPKTWCVDVLYYSEAKKKEISTSLKFPSFASKISKFRSGKVK